jgi:hypothetical protein
MASRDTNNQKRDEIKAIMAALFAQGWTATMLAAYMGHTTSCISSWKLGKSMGTNAERAELAALPAPGSPEVAKCLAASVVAAEKEVRAAEDHLARELAPKAFAKTMAHALSSEKFRMQCCQNGLADADRDPESRAQDQAGLAKCQALINDPAKLEAHVRANIERWSKISGARQALKDAQAAVEAQKSIGQ